MPVMDGLEATRRIVGGASRVVVLTTYGLDEYVYDALRAGASGFLLKHAPPEELLLGVRAAADGVALVSPAVTRLLIEAFTGERPRPARPPAALSLLTIREREVFDLMVGGLTNTEIARTLRIAETTVKTHAGRALAKLDLRDRVHAVLYAYEHHLVTPG
jgi:DNA-binding NarL/FixJ family response regulator